MIRNLLILLLFWLPLSASSCYSIVTKVDSTTPVSPLYDYQMYQAHKCHNDERPFLFKDNKAFFGCYAKRKKAEWVLQHSNFPFKNPKIVYHKILESDPYIILPTSSKLSIIKVKKKLQRVYKKNTIENISKKFPNSFYGNGIEVCDFSKITFLPKIALYAFHEQYHKIGAADRVLILYDGVYSLEKLYKKLHNDRYIKKVGEKRYELKIPIIVSNTASLVIQNKTILLQTKPKAVFIIYFGKLYLKNNVFYTWNTDKNRYQKREKIPPKELLTFSEEARPYFTGYAGSKAYMVNNVFKGLGFHSSPATFSVSLFYYPNDRTYYTTDNAFFYYIAKKNYPTGIYVGNDISDSCMAFYTSGADGAVYLGNYAHDNMIYNFDPHDYSNGLVIANNLATRAKHAHGIIVSRSVDHSIIADNISVNNHSAGIMTDRTSNHNAIYNNVTIHNGYMGISIQEGLDTLIQNNIVALNKIDGIMIRNSQRVSIVKNRIFENEKNGIEVISRNIDSTKNRNFQRDPYSKATASVIKYNTIKDNYNTNIMVKNSAAIFLEANKNSAFKKVSGDLEFFVKDIAQNNGKFRLYGRGFPFHAISTDKRVLNPIAFDVAKNIYVDIADSPNNYFGTDFGIAYLQHDMSKSAQNELLRASTALSNGALTYLGYFYLTQQRLAGFNNRAKIKEGLTLIIEDTILQNPEYLDLKKLTYFIPHSHRVLQEAFQEAKQRMKEGELFSKVSYKSSLLCRNTLKERRHIQAALKVFLYKMRMQKSEDILAYEDIVNRKFTIFTKPNVLKLRMRMRAHDDLQIEEYKAQQHFIKSLAKSDLCQKYKQRQDYLHAQTNTINRDFYKREIKKLLPELKKRLAAINRYRKRQISMQEFLDILYYQRGKEK